MCCWFETWWICVELVGIIYFNGYLDIKWYILMRVTDCVNLRKCGKFSGFCWILGSFLWILWFWGNFGDFLEFRNFLLFSWDFADFSGILWILHFVSVLVIGIFGLSEKNVILGVGIRQKFVKFWCFVVGFVLLFFGFWYL